MLQEAPKRSIKTCFNNNSNSNGNNSEHANRKTYASTLEPTSDQK